MRNQTRLILMAIFLGVLTAAGVMFWVVTERLGADAATAQIDEILDRTEQTALSTISNSSQNIERVEATLIYLASNAEAVNSISDWAMLQALEFVPELSGVYIANGEGDFQFVFRDDDGFGTKLVDTNVDGDGARQVRFTELDETLVQTSTWLDADDTFDPRTRPWYQAAVANPGVSVWTDPYLFFTSEQPGITHSIASSDPTARWVVGVDVQLESLVLLLDELSTQNSGEVFIFDGEETALSRNGLVDLTSKPTTADLRMRAALEAGADDGDVADAGEGNGVGDDDRIEFDVDGQPHTARFTPITLGGDGSWVIVTDLADADVAVPVRRIVTALQLLALGTVAIAGIALAFLLVPATMPIRRLEEDATIDVLTSLPNRRAILQLGEAQCARRGDVAAAMVDVDKFKQVNDNYGHFVGDEALRGLAQRLAESGHEVGRLGGEEFVVLLDSNTPNAALAVEELRRSVAAAPVATAAGPIQLTISVGLAMHESGEGFTDMLKRADGALLEAKLHGRDQVVVARIPTLATAGTRS